jgi:hypothetical protein
VCVMAVEADGDEGDELAHWGLSLAAEDATPIDRIRVPAIVVADGAQYIAPRANSHPCVAAS